MRKLLLFILLAFPLFYTYSNSIEIKNSNKINFKFSDNIKPKQLSYISNFEMNPPKAVFLSAIIVMANAGNFLLVGIIITIIPNTMRDILNAVCSLSFIVAAGLAVIGLILFIVGGVLARQYYGYNYNQEKIKNTNFDNKNNDKDIKILKIKF